ncbi:hypothetical protein D6W19_003115 [Escherichia coli]|nr:hypothetical protein [Escherichia coli]
MTLATVQADRQLITSVCIITDYTLRFIRNNKDAKLVDIKARIESKIILLVGDGCSESSLRTALLSATSSHTKAALKLACEEILASSERYKNEREPRSTQS